MRPSQAAMAIRDECARIQGRHRAAMAAIANETLSVAIKRSSGPWTLSELAEADHPYARRHGSPRLDPSMINVQRGVFRSSWYAVQRVGGYVVINDSDVADFVQFGTKSMFARPIKEAVEFTVQQRVEAMYAKAMRLSVA